MSTDTRTLESLLDEFRAVIDDDILNLQLSLIRLDELRDSVMKQDSDVLANLIETIKIQAQDYEQAQLRRNEVIGNFADVFGVDKNNVTVSFICERIASEKKKMLLDKKRQLQELVDKMRIDYISVFMLIQEFSKINKMLLRSLVQDEDSGMMYDHRGKSKISATGSVISGRV